MATIYQDVKVRIDTDEIWQEVLDDMSTDEIEDYLKKRHKGGLSTSTMTKKDVESVLLSIARLRLSPNMLCCKDRVKDVINETMNELWWW